MDMRNVTATCTLRRCAVLVISQPSAVKPFHTQYRGCRGLAVNNRITAGSMVGQIHSGERITFSQGRSRGKAWGKLDLRPVLAHLPDRRRFRSSASTGTRSRLASYRGGRPVKREPSRRQAAVGRSSAALYARRLSTKWRMAHSATAPGRRTARSAATDVAERGRRTPSPDRGAPLSASGNPWSPGP